jgi:hypothetical protein
MIAELQALTRKRTYGDRNLLLRFVGTTPGYAAVANAIFDDAESPIERILFAELLMSLHTSKADLAKVAIILQPAITLNDGEETKTIHPDGVLITSSRKIAVECDGFTYHGDEEMFISDRARDRKLIAAGYIPVRFASSEIFNHPRNCAWELITMIPEVQAA